MNCCICGEKNITKGLDPWPVNYDDGAVCCPKCYTLKVLPKIVEKHRYLEKHNLTNSVEVDSEVVNG